LISPAFKTAPFRIEEEGWGEFDMQIGLVAPDKEHVITHDLHFQQTKYESKHTIVSLSLSFTHPFSSFHVLVEFSVATVVDSSISIGLTNPKEEDKRKAKKE
jgi:transcription initiation factor IIF auxiliary subunit